MRRLLNDFHLAEFRLGGRPISEGKILIVDIGVGNFGSLINMIKRVGGRSELCSDPNMISAGNKLVLPGVGNFETGINNLRERGLEDPLNEARQSGAKILGVCLGMQLMTSRSDESDSKGLGWFDVDTKRFPRTTSAGDRLLVPHMGWNTVICTKIGLRDQAYVSDGRYYFVHSFYVDAVGRSDCLATTRYGDIEFASSIGRGNVQGVQFHPEKSHKFGMSLFNKFVNE